MSSVLRSWVVDLPLREQGTLIVALRGCDLAPKLPLDSVERRLTAAIRFAACHPADPREVDSAPGCFMLSEPPDDIRLGMLEHYPLHYVTHAIFACEVIGWRHPDGATADKWLAIYKQLVRGLHMTPETFDQYRTRLAEDRIASNTVVQL